MAAVTTVSWLSKVILLPIDSLIPALDDHIYFSMRHRLSFRYRLPRN